MPQLSDQRALDAARLITLITASVLDEAAFEAEADTDRLSGEIQLMIGGYLKELAQSPREMTN